MMLSLVRTIDRMTRLIGYAAAGTTVVLIAAMVTEVCLRYLLNSPTFWAYEIGYMLMGAGLMLGIAYTTQMKSHVRVDFFYNVLSPCGRAAVDLLGFAILLPMVLWMTAGLWDYLAYAYVNSEVSGESAWNPVVWPFRATFVLGFALFALQIVAEFLKSLHILMRGAPLEADDAGLGPG